MPETDDLALPAFPSGRRETPQHREWLALYKAHQRVAGAGGIDPARFQELLLAQRGRCPVCRAPLEPADAGLDVRSTEAASADEALLHRACLQLVSLARTLGPEALDRVKHRL